jgi:hypothetical protein
MLYCPSVRPFLASSRRQLNDPFVRDALLQLASEYHAEVFLVYTFTLEQYSSSSQVKRQLHK